MPKNENLLKVLNFLVGKGFIKETNLDELETDMTISFSYSEIFPDASNVPKWLLPFKNDEDKFLDTFTYMVPEDKMSEDYIEMNIYIAEITSEEIEGSKYLIRIETLDGNSETLYVSDDENGYIELV